jgi:hypothetical protein
MTLEHSIHTLSHSTHSLIDLDNGTFPQRDVRVRQHVMISMPLSPAKVGMTFAYMLVWGFPHVVPKESPSNDDTELDHCDLLTYTIPTPLEKGWKDRLK